MSVMFSIGEMAKLFHLNIRTLRYYDELGILKPEHVNPETNYRYYSTNQFERLNTIKYLRALDVPLEQIAGFLEEKEVATILSIFEEQREHVRNKQKQLALIEKKIANRIEQIESALSAPYGQIAVKHIPQRRVVVLEQRFSPSDDLEPLIRNLSKAHALDDALFLGKVGISISREDLERRQYNRYSAVFVVVEAEDGVEEAGTILPEGTYISVLFQGTHEEAAPNYDSLLNYLQASGYRIGGNSVEITIIDAGMTSDSGKFVTELQIPVIPAGT